MNLKTAIDENKLIEHLEQMFEQENAKLIDMAVDAMEGNSGLPFEELSLVDSQREYKLAQQRVFGILDTIEEVKAFLEGYFDGRPQTETEGK